jgi:hypothetical protein
MIIEIANDAIIKTWGKEKISLENHYSLNHARNNNWGFAEILADVYKTGIPFHAYETPVGLVHGEN